MAQAYPNAEIHGFDYHSPSVDAAREGAGIAGVGDRVQFQVATADAFHGLIRPDLLLRLLARHGRPGRNRHPRQGATQTRRDRDARRTIRSQRQGDEPWPADCEMLYGASTAICTPNSLSQDVGRAMGAQAGEPGMSAVFDEAGYSQFRRVAETPFNIVYEARV